MEACVWCVVYVYVLSPLVLGTTRGMLTDSCWWWFSLPWWHSIITIKVVVTSSNSNSECVSYFFYLIHVFAIRFGLSASCWINWCLRSKHWGTGLLAPRQGGGCVVSFSNMNKLIVQQQQQAAMNSFNLFWLLFAEWMNEWSASQMSQSVLLLFCCTHLHMYIIHVPSFYMPFVGLELIIMNPLFSGVNERRWHTYHTISVGKYHTMPQVNTNT